MTISVITCFWRWPTQGARRPGDRPHINGFMSCEAFVQRMREEPGRAASGQLPPRGRLCSKELLTHLSWRPGGLDWRIIGQGTRRIFRRRFTAKATVLLMARIKIDLNRRAEIGQERRAKTRAQLLSAASSLISRHPVEALTIDEIVKEAGVAKGTFYVHFEDMHALVVAVADQLINSFDELFQPQREALEDPVTRIAFGCASFIERAIEDPAWAGVVGHMASSHPLVGQRARQRLRDDLEKLFRDSPESRRRVEPAVSLEVVVGIVLQTLGAISQRRLEPTQARTALWAILICIGVEPKRIGPTINRVRTLMSTAREECADPPVASNRKKRTGKAAG